MEFCGFLIILVVLLVNVLILNYVRKLEIVSCECSEDWKRDYIKIYSLITIIITSLVALVPIFLQLINFKYNVNTILSNNIVSIFSFLYTMFGLLNVYSLFTYSQKIVLTNCECSDSWERTFLYYYSMLVMSLYIFMGALLLIAVICCGSLNIDLKFIKDLKKMIKKN